MIDDLLANEVSMSNLIWLDLEMSGLDVEINRIIEIAVVITDFKLNILSKGPSLVIHQSKLHMDAMDDWCTEHHAKTGLTNEVLASNINEKHAENSVINFIKDWVIPGESPMCGNSIGTDREFIKHYMPTLFSWFHYRNFDVSTLKMAGAWWCDKNYKKSDSNQHRAMFDILESINEAKYYMQNFYTKY